MKLSKNQVGAIGLIALGIVMYPVTENWADDPKDSFPFSYYPMFSKKRDKMYGLYYVVGYDSTDNKVDIPYRLLGTGGFNQVRRQIKKATKNKGGVPFLKNVAKRIQKKDGQRYERLTRIELVKGYYHIENYFLKSDTLPVLERAITNLEIE